MRAALETAAQRREVKVAGSEVRYPRVGLRRRDTPYPTAEHLLTVVPALVANKTADNFPRLWAEITGTEESGQLRLFARGPV